MRAPTAGWNDTPVLYDDDEGGNASGDDPAIWVNPEDDAESIVIVTAKDGGLRVYDLLGDELQSLFATAAPRADGDRRHRRRHRSVQRSIAVLGHRSGRVGVRARVRRRCRRCCISPRPPRRASCSPCATDARRIAPARSAIDAYDVTVSSMRPVGRVHSLATCLSVGVARSASTAVWGSGTVIVITRWLWSESRTVGPLRTVQLVRFGVHQNP